MNCGGRGEGCERTLELNHRESKLSKIMSPFMGIVNRSNWKKKNGYRRGYMILVRKQEQGGKQFLNFDFQWPSTHDGAKTISTNSQSMICGDDCTYLPFLLDLSNCLLGLSPVPLFKS